jgi:hypothetical protein
MDPHIGHWHCRYRRVGAQLDAALAVDRLEHTIRPRVLAAYGNVLDQIFENDPAVYVLRRVSAAFTLDGVKAKTEIALADAWGNKLGAAVMRGIATHAEDGGNLVKFENEAEYVAHFIADLLNDLAWDRWYYGAYSELRGVGKPHAILSLLLDRRELLESIFSYLSRLGCLDRVLGLLDRSAITALWSEAIHPLAKAPFPEEFRLFVRGAICLIDRLSLWADGSPTESDLLDRYAAERTAKPDWSSRQSLAAVVLNVVRFLVRHDYLREPDQTLAVNLSRSRGVVFVDLDWVDTDWLEAELPATLAKVDSASSAHSRWLLGPLWPTRPVTITPSQVRLLERIQALLRSGRVAIDLDEIDSPANAVRIYAALAAEEPQFAGQRIAASMIESLLCCTRWMASTPDHRAALASLRGGATTETFDQLSAETRAAIQTVASLGPNATVIVEELVKNAGVVSQSDVRTIVATECAGLFLLVRAVMDTRLPQLVETSGAGSLPAVLLALGIQWAGRQAVRDGNIDPGLAVWCGLNSAEPATADLLSDLDEEGCRRLLEHVSRVYEQRRALDQTLPQVEAPVPPTNFADLAADWPATSRIRADLDLVGVYLLRLWAHWLRGVAGSSVPYLLENLVRRGGELHMHENLIEVALHPKPLDVVLEMAMYTKKIDMVPWLENRSVCFRIDRE